jgi:hypothetical protein
MKLGQTYDEEDYEYSITIVGLCHEKRQREIEHKKKLDNDHCMKGKGRKKDASKPNSANH